MSSASASQFCLEVAVFAADRDVSAEQRVAHDVLKTYPGFIASLALVSTKDPLARADLVLWASFAAATEAAKAFAVDERVLPYTKCITSINLFGHYDNVSVEGITKLKTAPVIELAALKELPEDITKTRTAVHATLADNVDVVVNIAAVGCVTELAVGTSAHEPAAAEKERCAGLDVIGWISMEGHEGGPAFVVGKRPDLAPFFAPSAMENIALFETYIHV